jgi:Tfp pilus assembly protein PilF
LAQAHYNLGVEYMQIRRIDDAETSFERAVEIDSEYGRAYGALAQVARMRGDRSGVAEHMQRAEQLLAANERQQQSLSAMPWATGTPVSGAE